MFHITSVSTLDCYSCSCADTACPCTTQESSSDEDTYCVIIRQNFGQHVLIDLEHIGITDTRNYITEFPYALVEESIDYNEGTGRWITTTNAVIYGCNWNLCNKPELISLLPDSYQMRLPEVWLNSSILGTGQPVRDCHECPDSPQCGNIDFLDASRCPIKACNTTCIVSESFDDPSLDYQCYQSYCSLYDDDMFPDERHHVEIEGVMYASQIGVVDIWEIDIYCRADDCSRPDVFKELREQLTIQPGNLAALFNETHDPNIPQRRCYDCYCFDDRNCPCGKTTVRPANSTYCTIVVETFGQDVLIVYEHLDRESTRIFIRDFPYLLAEESIIYSEKAQRWDTVTNLVIYGCNWDYCNDPRFLPYLPNSFQMRINETWLNNNVLGTGQPVRDCHECPEGPQCGTTDFLDAGRCPIRACNTTCLVSDLFNDPSLDEQCYQSFCAPPDGDDFIIDPHRVEIEGILYLNKPSREVEVWEVDIYCRADDCSRPEIFKELRAELRVQLGDLSVFVNQTSPRTTTKDPSSTGITQATAWRASFLVIMGIFISLNSLIFFNLNIY